MRRLSPSARPTPTPNSSSKVPTRSAPKLVPQLAEAYKASHPGVSFSIAAEGSTTGIAAIIDGTADIGMASRRAFPTEVSAASANGRTLKPTIVAYDGIAVIVNTSNSVGALSKKQIEAIFSGEVTDWSAVGGKPGTISVYTRNTSSAPSPISRR